MGVNNSGQCTGGGHVPRTSRSHATPTTTGEALHRHQLLGNISGDPTWQAAAPGRLCDISGREVGATSPAWVGDRGRPKGATLAETASYVNEAEHGGLSHRCAQ